MSIWRPGPSSRPPAKPLIDLTVDAAEPEAEPLAEPEVDREAEVEADARALAVAGQDPSRRMLSRDQVERIVAHVREGAQRALVEEVERRRKIEAEAAAKIEAIRQQQAGQHRQRMAEARAAADAALKAEQQRRREAEAEVRALRQRVETAEAGQRRAARFVEVAADVLHPAAMQAITALASKRKPVKVLPEGEGLAQDHDREPAAPAIRGTDAKGFSMSDQSNPTPPAAKRGRAASP